MPTPPDQPHHEDGPPEMAALRREVSALMHRWQDAGVPLYEVAMVLATVGCQARTRHGTCTTSRRPGDDPGYHTPAPAAG
jgi:hypothetical protein